MSRLSVPPPTRPLVSDETPKPKAALSVPNGKALDVPPPSSKQAAAAAATMARSPSPEPKGKDDKIATTMAAADAFSQSEDAMFPVIDMDTFEQILELDEDDTREFSSEMVWQYFAQAKVTFVDMDDAFKDKSLTRLSELGHFLKGSSAALGVARVQATCERIQNYGKLWDDHSNVTLSEPQALTRLEPLLKRVKKEFTEAEKWLTDWYKEQGVDRPED